MFIEGKVGQMKNYNSYALKVVCPGFNGKTGSISFQTFDNKWLIENKSKIEVASYDSTRRFRFLSTFIASDSKWFPGYSAFESSVNSSNYLTHDGKWLRMDRFEDSMHFKSSSSWRILDRGKIVLFAPNIFSVCF